MGPWAGVSMVRRSWLLVILLAVLAMVASLVVSPAAAAPPATSGKPEALAPAAAQAVEPLAQASPPYTPVPPVRIADTRVRQPVAFPASKVPVPAGGTLEVPVVGSMVCLVMRRRWWRISPRRHRMVRVICGCSRVGRPALVRQH